MITLSIGIGLVVGFVLSELTGLSAGGLVVPGYLALYLDQPVRVASTIVVALLTYSIVLLLSRIMLLYGRRRFMASVLIGFGLTWLTAMLPGQIPFARADLQAIGHIIPGLIANEAAKCGVLRTFGSALLAAMIVRSILLLLR